MGHRDDKPEEFVGADYQGFLRGAAKEMHASAEEARIKAERDLVHDYEKREEIKVRVVREKEDPPRWRIEPILEPFQVLVFGTIPPRTLVVYEQSESFLVPEFRFNLAKQMVIHGVVDRVATKDVSRLSVVRTAESARLHNAQMLEAAKERCALIEVRVEERVLR